MNTGNGSCGSGCGCGQIPGLTAAKIAAMLVALGYSAVSNVAGGVDIAERIDGEAYKAVIVIAGDGELTITCQVDTLARAGESAESQRDYLFNALDINDSIAPFATSILTPNDDVSIRASDAPPVIVVSRFNVLGTDVHECLRWQMAELRRAVVYFNQHVRDLVVA